MKFRIYRSNPYYIVQAKHYFFCRWQFLLKEIGTSTGVIKSILCNTEEEALQLIDEAVSNRKPSYYRIVKLYETKQEK